MEMKVFASLLCLAVAFVDPEDHYGMALLQVTHGRVKINQNLTATISTNADPPESDVQETIKRHRVEHIDLLSQTAFWWMMAVVIVLVTVVVIRTDTKEQNADTDDDVQKAERTFEADASVRMRPDSPKSLNSNEAGAPPTVLKTRSNPSLSKELETFYSWESLKKLAFCFIALNTSMILWGIAQEFIMTNVYVGRHGQILQLPSPLFLVLCNRTTTMIFSSILLRLRGQVLFFSGAIDALPPAVSNTCASWSQYACLGYISFGLQTTAKSIKILPVVIISSLRGRVHSLTDYAECLVLACACFVFGFESEAGSDSMTTLTGLVLLAAYILCDSLTPHFQDILFQKHEEIDAVQATLAMSSIAVVLMLIEMTLTFKLFESVAFIWQCPEAALHMLVLSLASTLTQYMIAYTIKHFGPVVFTIISSTRQAISVLVSAVLFSHHISGLALTAMFIMVGTLMVRALRPLAKDHKELEHVEPEDYQRVPLLKFSEKLSSFSPLFVCTSAIHIVYVVYTLLQEFLSTHTFEGHLFNFPLTLVAISHTAAALLSLADLRIGGHDIFVPGLWQTVLPGSTDLVATTLQHAALYKMYFPAQSLMKTLKVLPVMVIGTCVLRNRNYSRLDYAEGFLLSCLVAFFVWDFQFAEVDLDRGTIRTSASGILMMVGYVIVDSFTSNFEDSIYQKLNNLQPGHMLLGMETFSAALAWAGATTSGELTRATQFVIAEPKIIFFLSIFALTAAVGSLACVLTVRLFGPAVFTLIMTSRAILSLLLSVWFFQHTVNTVNCVSLVAVCIITLMSSTRRVSAQMRQLQPRQSTTCAETR